MSALLEHHVGCRKTFPIPFCFATNLCDVRWPGTYTYIWSKRWVRWKFAQINTPTSVCASIFAAQDFNLRANVHIFVMLFQPQVCVCVWLCAQCGKPKWVAHVVRRLSFNFADMHAEIRTIDASDSPVLTKSNGISMVNDGRLSVFFTRTLRIAFSTASPFSRRPRTHTSTAFPVWLERKQWKLFASSAAGLGKGNKFNWRTERKQRAVGSVWVEHSDYVHVAHCIVPFSASTSSSRRELHMYAGDALFRNLFA